MKKNLPNVFASPINKSIKNNKEYYYNKETRTSITNDEDVLRNINEIFASSNHVYKSKVELTLDDGVYEEYIVGKTGNSVLTLDGKRININKIRKVKKI